MSTRSCSLPKSYMVAPYVVDFSVPGFEAAVGPSSAAAWKTLAPRPNIECDEWFRKFMLRIHNAMREREFLPVCKVGDGEMMFLVGRRHVDVRWPLRRRTREWLSILKWGFIRRGGFAAYTKGRYSSGVLSRAEWKMLRREATHHVVQIARIGVLAIRLNFGLVAQEAYFPPFKAWLDGNAIQLNSDNYYPCYFVYCALAGENGRNLVRGQRILVVNGSRGTKKDRIIRGLLERGARDVSWCPIDPTHSVYSRLDVRRWRGSVDIVLLGAGLGKFHLMPQLAELSVPCIDAGFMLDVWADPRAKFERVFCATDDEWRQAGRDPKEVLSL